MIFLGLTGRLLCGIACMLLSFNLMTNNTNVISAETDDQIIEVVEEPIIESGETIIEEEQEVEEETNFIKPIRAGVVTSRFGTRWGRLHGGIDIADKTGTEIYAAKAGEVVYAGWSGNYGKLVRIKHVDGYETYYAHCSSVLVSVGDQVAQNQLIARIGMTGNATGPHVHFEIRENGRVINPYDYIY